jgi:hypothetical protein
MFLKPFSLLRTNCAIGAIRAQIARLAGKLTEEEKRTLHLDARGRRGTFTNLEQAHAELLKLETEAAALHESQNAKQRSPVRGCRSEKPEPAAATAHAPAAHAPKASARLLTIAAGSPTYSVNLSRRAPTAGPIPAAPLPAPAAEPAAQSKPPSIIPSMPKVPTTTTASLTRQQLNSLAALFPLLNVTPANTEQQLRAEVAKAAYQAHNDIAGLTDNAALVAKLWRTEKGGGLAMYMRAERQRAIDSIIGK